MQLYWAAHITVIFKFTQQNWKYKNEVLSIWNNISKCNPPPFFSEDQIRIYYFYVFIIVLIIIINCFSRNER